MTNNDGEDVLDTLLFLGYAVDIADDGAITATQGTETIRGKAASGAVEWSDRSAIFRVRERAYIAHLRARVHAARAAGRKTEDSPANAASPKAAAVPMDR